MFGKKWHMNDKFVQKSNGIVSWLLNAMYHEPHLKFAVRHIILLLHVVL